MDKCFKCSDKKRVCTFNYILKLLLKYNSKINRVSNKQVLRKYVWKKITTGRYTSENLNMKLKVIKFKKQW